MTCAIAVRPRSNLFLLFAHSETHTQIIATKRGITTAANPVCENSNRPREPNRELEEHSKQILSGANPLGKNCVGVLTHLFSRAAGCEKFTLLIRPPLLIVQWREPDQSCAPGTIPRPLYPIVRIRQRVVSWVTSGG